MKFLKNIISHASYAFDSVRRDKSHLILKMDLFVAKYPGSVIGKTIPLISGYKGIEESNDGPIKYYIRIEFSSGATKFAWFHSLIGAEEYLLLEASPDKNFDGYPNLKVINVIGPYELPWGKDERFM
jgi:hypothetical protein